MSGVSKQSVIKIPILLIKKPFTFCKAIDLVRSFGLELAHNLLVENLIREKHQKIEPGNSGVHNVLTNHMIAYASAHEKFPEGDLVDSIADSHGKKCVLRAREIEKIESSLETDIVGMKNIAILFEPDYISENGDLYVVFPRMDTVQVLSKFPFDCTTYSFEWFETLPSKEIVKNMFINLGSEIEGPKERFISRAEGASIRSLVRFFAYDDLTTLDFGGLSNPQTEHSLLIVSKKINELVRNGTNELISVELITSEQLEAESMLSTESFNNMMRLAISLGN